MNHTNSRRAFTTFFYIDETSVPDADSFEKRIRYLLGSRRHVKTLHADKRVPMELKATSFLIRRNFWYQLQKKKEEEKKYTQKAKKKRKFLL